MTAVRNNPTVSVIIPVLNDQIGLDKCLTALSCQSYPSNLFDVVIVDNDSIKAITLDGAVSLNGRIIQCGKHGSYAARNHGVRASSGEILAFTDADCIPDIEWLSRGVTSVLRHGGTNPVGGDVVLFSENPHPSPAEHYQLLTGFYQQENISQKLFSVTANLFIPRTIFEEVGPFDEGLLSGGDREWGIRANQRAQCIVFEPNAIVRHRCRTSLGLLIRQARRVAGGRFIQASKRVINKDTGSFEPHRKPFEALMWLATHPQLNWTMRPKVMAVAFLVWFSRVLETLRLHFGGTPLR